MSIVLVRMLPVSNAIINIGLALSHVGDRAFLLGSLLGFLPQGIIAVIIGSGMATDVPWMGAAQIGVAGIVLFATFFWTARKQWFFKPAAGYGSKAAYRGDKLTRRVFAEISAGGYIAQALVPPSERCVRVDGVTRSLKLDVRNFVYRGSVQLVSARLYQGQMTNFRTHGGGFAAVLAV